MRVSTADFYRQSIVSLQRQQSLALQTQNQLSSGSKLQTAADDPTGAAHGLSLDQTRVANQRYTENTKALGERLGLEENALSGITETLNRVRERALQGNGGTLGDSDRASIAADLRQSLDSLLDYANAADGEGRYLFAGSNDASAPFSLSGGGTQFSGDDVIRQVQIGPNRAVQSSDGGAEVFLRQTSGNGTFSVAATGANTGTATIATAKVFDAAAWDGGSYNLSFAGGNYSVQDGGGNVVASGAYTAGQSIRFKGADLTVTGAPADGDSFSIGPSQQQDLFQTVRDLITLFETPTAANPAARAKVQTGVLDRLGALETAQSKVIDVRARLGARLVAAEDAQNQLSSQLVKIDEALSGIRDIDYAEAASRLTQQLTGLQAAQQSFAKIQGLSLFNYLR
ncbi:flagellar hook-associated protein FlgL [Nevskia sp.]|uniref:flagellar hook-associated protein FlgL n=1 Tax=Nevskia sp. TaxID=1929292 RepID=UPI0025D4EB47|nr:flagellar hook-associated protein FlgL [Nevskia sp.]